MKKHLHEEIPQLLTSFEDTEKQLHSLQLDSHNTTTRTGLDMLDKYRLEVHDMIEKHFDNLKLSYLALSSTVPCKETTQILVEYIDDTKKQLKVFQEKFGGEITENDQGL